MAATGGRRRASGPPDARRGRRTRACVLSRWQPDRLSLGKRRRSHLHYGRARWRTAVAGAWRAWTAVVPGWKADRLLDRRQVDQRGTVESAGDFIGWWPACRCVGFERFESLSLLVSRRKSSRTGKRQWGQ